MTRYLIGQDRITAANFLLESTKMGSQEVVELLAERFEEFSLAEQESRRLVEIGRGFDPVSSMEARLVLGIGSRSDDPFEFPPLSIWNVQN